MATTVVHQGLDPTQFRHVIGHFMSGVAVITTRHAERDHGMTASAVSSLSLDPPMLTVCLNRGVPTQEAIYSSGAFGVSILREGQDELAQRFATPRADKFDGVAFTYGPLGQPLLAGALAAMECEVTESVVGGTHRVFLATVRHAEVAAGAPLAYYRGRFGRLEIAADEQALRRVRRAILAREVALDQRLDAATLGVLLDVPASSVEYSLTRLLSEQLVTRDPDGYRQRPLDVRRSDDAFDAKLVLDLGAMRLALRRASDSELNRLVELAGRTAPDGGGAMSVEEVERHVAANEAFHEYAIELAGNEALLLAYRQLKLPTILAQVLLRDVAAAEELAREHVQIAEALRSRDLTAAERLIAEHHTHGRQAHHDAIVAAGGRI
jgi:4-nitrophenol 2-monooxygenase / 4-nitrocatechol 4-monooxygenase, reductase component